MATTQVRVTRDKQQGWKLSRGKRDVVGTFKTQREAIDKDRAFARDAKAGLIWQGRDGHIVGRNSYGNDSRRRPG